MLFKGRKSNDGFEDYFAIPRRTKIKIGGGNSKKMRTDGLVNYPQEQRLSFQVGRTTTVARQERIGTEQVATKQRTITKALEVKEVAATR